MLQVHEVLDQLESEDELMAQIVKLRFFVGLNHREIADLSHNYPRDENPAIIEWMLGD